MYKKYKYSIIIPIFQAERYLATCVNSVLEQSYDNYEIILVNDGSFDQSPYICEALKRQDSRVKVIHKKNGGASDARNVGIKEAKGDYILFLDSDDYWDDKDALLKINERLNRSNADVLNYNFKKCDEETGQKADYIHKHIDMPLEWSSKKKQLDFIGKNSLLLASACNKALKRNLFHKDMFFETGVSSEDIEWSARLLKEADSFDYNDLSFYCYRQRAGSTSHNIKEKNCIDLANHILACLEMLEHADESIECALKHFTAFQYATFIMVQTKTEKVPEEYIEKLKKYSWILKYHAGNKKLIILNIMCQLIGYKNTCRIFRIVLQNRGVLDGTTYNIYAYI